MERVLMAAMAATTLAAAGSASAQPYGYGGGYGYGGSQGDRLEQRIDRAARNGALSWREASYLSNAVNAVERLEWRYRQNGLSPWEARDLQRRYDSIRQQIRWERSDDDGEPGRRHGWGYGHGWR